MVNMRKYLPLAINSIDTQRMVRQFEINKVADQLFAMRYQLFVVFPKRFLFNSEQLIANDGKTDFDKLT